MRRYVAIALAAVLLVAAGPKESNVPPSPASLDGSWAVVGGHILIERDNRDLKVDIRGTEVRWFRDDTCECRWGLRFPASGHARHVDIYDTENPLKPPCRAIYALEGNRLKICIAADLGQQQPDRPTDFTNGWLIILQRR